MKHLPLISSFCSTPRRKLYMAIAAQMIVTAGAHASPNGGTVVGGDGIIEQSGLDTTIIQNTGHLAIDWQSFNIAAEERVQFIQPDTDSVALNRILGNEASQIFGRLDANGHVILMNPNGVLFGEGASVNVGGLVASGLNINADDFMNGDYVLQAVDGKDGTVINNGIINAATGGNVALIGKQVDNQGLISANLGAVTLAAGKEAVLTFDNQGLLGVRVSKEILQDELGVNAAVTNSGDISAEGGRILMTGSVSQDIFSQAVNAEGLNAKTSVVIHEDGSFTLGAGADVVNTGTISTSSDTTDAGQIVVLGENVNSSGAILAKSKTANAAGNIEIHSRDTTLLTEQSHTSATNDGAGSGGQIKILGDRVGVLDQSQINTSGTKGGGDISIGGGFQGKDSRLRNASRTVVGKDTLIEANAISEGDGGDVIVWADETTSFTGEINVRGGGLGGDGGFVEVSGKENLKFDGRVDRSAPNGKAGELLLDPEEIIIVSRLGQQDDELDDAQILGSDGLGLIFTISTAAIEAALTTGDVSLSAERFIGLNESDEIRIVAQDGNTNNLYFGFSTQSGLLDFSSGVFIDLGLGDLRISAYTGATLSGNYYANNIDIQTQGTSFHDVVFAAQGDFTMLGAGSITSSEGFRNTISARNIFVRPRTTGGTAGSLNNVSLTAFSASIEASEVTLLDTYIEDSFEFIGTGTRYPGFSVRGDNYVGGNLNVQTSDLTFYEDSRLEVGARTDISAGWVAQFQRNSALFSRDNIALSGSAVQYDIEENATIRSDGIVDLGSQNIAFNGGQIQAAGGVTSTASIIQSANIVGDFTWNGVDINLFGNNTITGEVNIVASEGLVLGQPTVEGDITSIVVNGSFSANADSFVFADGVVINTSDSLDIANGDINLTSQQDVALPTIFSGGDLNVESTLGSVSFAGVVNVGGDTSLSAAEDIVFLAAGAGESDVPASIVSENGDVHLSARNIDMGSWDENHTPLDIGGSFTVIFEEFARIKGVLHVDEGAEISTQTGMLSFGWGSINTLGFFSANLADGSYDGGLETGGFMSINAGQIDIIGSELLLADVELNGDSTLGTGNINITMTGDGDFAYPSINRQRLVTTGALNIDLQSSGATTRFYGDESSAINVDGAATISAIGDLIIPTLDVKGDLSVTSLQGGITFTNSTFEAPTLPSLVSVEGDVIFSAGTDFILTEGSGLSVGGETTITAEDDISLLETSIFLPGDNVYLNAGNDINIAASSNPNALGFIELAESNPASFIFNAGRNIVIRSALTLGSGDFVASAGTKAHSPSDFPVADGSLQIRSYEGPGIYARAIDTNGKVLFRSAHFVDTAILESGTASIDGYIGYYTDGTVVLPSYANSNGNFEVYNYTGAENILSEFQLSDGSIIELPEIASFESSISGYVGWYTTGADTTVATNGGDFYIEARKIQHWGAHPIDVSSTSGHGNITLIAEEEITAPPIVYSNKLEQGANEFSQIQFSAAKIRIDRNIDFNNGGIVDFSLDGSADVILGVVEDDMHYLELPALDRRVGGLIFDSVGGDTDQINIEITSSGTVFQKYDLFTGGGDYSATAFEFQFNDLVILNTDFANDTEDALFGTGNVSIQSTSDQAGLVLPGITTQTNCTDTSNCGTLKVSAASVDNKGEVRVSGNADFDSEGRLRLNNSYTLGNGEPAEFRNYFGGEISVNADFAEVTSTKILNLGEWNLNSTDSASFIAMQDADAASTIIGNKQLNVAGTFILGAGYVELKNQDSRVGALNLSASRAEIEYAGDLRLSGYLFGDASGSKSSVKVGGNLNISLIAGGFASDIPILEVDAAGGMLLDVGGNIEISGERNRLSSIQILNAQNVEIFNNGELTLDGVNAESLTLNVLGDIEQTAALNILGSTNINASVGANINLLDPLNDFASLSAQSAGPAIINIADVNNISLADIDLNGASQGGALSVRAATITQEENGRILLQDGTRLNVQADSISLGANGTATVDINGSVLNGVYANDLSIQGAIRGAEGAAGTGLAGFYFNGSGENNIFEVTEGASIVGDFLEGSNIYMGNGDDVANLAGDVAISIEGGAGQDTFFIEAPNLNIAQILGNGDQDILIGPDASNVWNITGNGEGALFGESAEVGFSGIESLRGGSQTDDFIVESPDVVVQLDGGDGLDSLSANLNDAIVNNQWVVDGINSGSLNELVLFSSVENLIGNDGADTVTFSEGAQIGDVSTGIGDDEFTLATDITTGLLDAGDGNDTLNLNGLNSIYTYLAERIGGDGDYTEINFEIENNEGGSKTIVGVDGYDAEWIIDADGSVTISALQGGTTETNRFTGVTRVEGASGNDTFILQGGYLADRIVGGQGGDDSLIADTGFANSWLIEGQNSGSIQVADSGREQLFEAITNLVGGADNDSFRILGGANFNGTIAGGQGTNSLEVADATATSVWTIASTNNLVVSPLAGAVSSMTFSDVQSLIGNDNEDVLDLSAVAGSVDLGENQAAGFLFQNFDTFISNGGNFLGTDADTSWILNEISEIAFRDLNGIDRKYTFSGFLGLHGGSGEDYFRIDGRWSAIGGQIFAESLSESADTAELNIDSSSAWNFNSGDSTDVYLNVTSDSLFAGTRSEASNSLTNIGNPFVLLGIENNIGGRADDIFLVYGDSGLFDPNIDGNEGNDYLVAYNWGTPQDLIWNITEDNGGDINNAVRFQNFENLKSHDFSDTNRDGHGSRFNLADGVAIGSLIGDSTDTEYFIGSGTVVGSISDNGGVDSITARGSNSWLLPNIGGSLNSTTFSGIEILNGGDDADDFVLSSSTTEVTQINGGAGENSLTAFNQDNTWTLSASDSTLNEIQFNSITNLVGNAGVDTFIVADDEVALNIDGGVGVDELTGLDQLNLWLVDGTYSGTLNEAIVFAGVEHLQGGAFADQFTVTDGSSVGQIAGGDGDDIILIGAGASAIYILGEAGSDSVELGDLVNITGYLDGGEGGLDVLDISAFTGAFEFDFATGTTNTGLTYSNFEQEVLPASGTSFFGGDGNTRWTFTEDSSFLIEKLDENGEVVKSGTYSNYNTVRGGVGVNAFVMSSDANFDGAIRGDASGNNSLTAADLVNLWILNGQNQGQLQVDGAAEVTLFSNIANLIGGASVDSFEIANGGSVTGSIDGGAGSDRLVITDAAANNEWVLATQNSVGVVVQFRGIEALAGNANDDSFNFTGQTDVTSIEGGDGQNALLWSAGDVAVNVGAQSINEAIIFSDITSFNADPENNNSLTGADQVNTWILDNTDSGTVNSISFSGFNQLRGGNYEDTLQGTDADNRWLNLDAADNALNDVLVFSGMEKLIGGAGADEFSAELVGVTAIDGGLGINQLAATGAVNNEWSIGGTNSGSFNTTLVFEGIQNLVGNAGNDTFTFAANSSIGNINSGAGEDTFILANNITAGILDGGDGLDILDRGGLNSIVTYLREVIGGDAVYTAANIETETSSGGSTTVVGVDGYSAEWRITGDGTVSVTVTDADGVAVTNEFTDVTRAEGGAGFDAFVLLEEGAIADGIIGDGSDYLQATETTNIWTIDAADGGELAVQEYGTRLLFQGIANLYGGNGSDLFEVTAGGSVSGSIYGGGGVDTLAIIDTTVTNNWQLGETNVVGLVADFREIETLIGNDNNDTFTFNGLTAVTSIDGEAGDNAVIWQMADVAINLGTSQINELINFGGINSFDADSAFENMLIGADESNAWTLKGAASGAVTNTQGEFAFNGFQNLVGGAMADAFTLTSEATGFVSIKGEAGADSLTAADQLNQWVLDAEGGELNGLQFANIEALTGGALQDNFVLADAASQAQIIDGGAGADRLAAYDQVNVWNVSGDNAGDVTGLASFSNIQTLIGGAQADTFTLAAGVNLSEIYAGAGNDLFVIGAGVVADNFFGEAGDDSVEVEVGLELSGVLDGGSGGETDGDYINLSKYTLLDATAELESVLGFAFLNFERIDEPNTQGVYFGGNGTNFWYITGANEGRLEIRDGEDAGVYEFSGVHSLMGGEGEDIFIFANDAAAVSTLIDGGEGSGANTLDLSAQGLINEWLLSGADSGAVSNASNANGNIFTNIAYLIGGSSQDVFDLQTGGSIAGAIDGGLGGDELRISVEQTSNWQLGGVAGHSVTGIASFTNIESLMGGAGVDNFDILAQLADVTQLNGGAGSDAVNFLYEAPVTVDLANGLAAGLRVESVERFTAADARSIFTGVESAATWTVDGTDQGTIQYLRPADGNLINVAFDGFGNLIGGAGDDQIVVAQGGSISGTLSGGDGRNSVDLQDVAGDIHVAVSPDVTIANGLARMTLADVDQLIGNGRTWLYGASDRSYTWTIDGLRSGQMTSTLVDDGNRLLAFENLSAIRGGTHDDIFQVIAESPLLSLDGGSAVTADLVDYSRVNGNLRISLADALTGQNGELTGVEGIRGNNAGPDSLHNAELVGPDSGAIWTIGGPVSDGLADGMNDGRVAFDEQTITFIDFNMLTGGAGVDTFNQSSGIVLGTLNGGAGDDVFNVDVVGANAGTAVIGGAGTDSLVLRGGDEAGLMTYTAAAGGGEFDYSLADVHYKVSHEGVESLRDRTLAASLDVRGSSAAETFSLANGRFWVNGGDVVEYGNKGDIAVRSGINDIIEIADNLVVENSLTLANGTVIANDPANNSIATAELILDSTRDVGLSSARLRTSVDNLLVRNSAGDIYLQEQNGVNLAEFNANGVFDLRLLNGDLTNSAPLTAADVVRIVAENGDVTLVGANQLRDDVAVSGNRVELHNASTLTLVEVNAEDLYLRTQRGIEGDGPITVAGLTEIDAGGDVLMDFATNDFNQLRVTNAVNLTVVDQNAIELLDINASGTVLVRSTNTVTLNDSVTGSNGVEVSSGTGSINQNGSISTNNGSVVVSAGNGEVNLGEDAKIVSNGGSVSISAGAGNVNMGGDTRIAANGGDVNIVAADSVVVAEVVSSGNVNIDAGSGSVSDGNGGATNVSAGGLQSSSNTGFGDDDALETNVGNIDITTNTGNVAVNNSGNVTVDKVSTGQGDISLVNQGDVELGGGSVVAENGANGGSVNIDVSQGSVSQSGSTSVPAVKGGGVVVINAPDGAIGEGGGLRVDAPFVEIIAAIKAGDIFVNPGADKIEYFSGSFKFDDQLLAVEPLEDINPAIFANVKSYFFNDISLLLPRDQLYEEEEEE